MFQIFGYFCFFLIGFAYIGYPITLFFLSIFRRRMKLQTSDIIPNGISIIITCRNEEKVIREKIENTLNLNFFEHKVLDELMLKNPRVQLIIASDASDDLTHRYVTEYATRGVKLVSLEERRGKESAQKEALKYVNLDLVLFTDAKIFLYQDVIKIIYNYFKNSSIGAVSSQDEVIDSKGRSGEGMYVKYEMWIRNLETNFYSLVGLSGSCFAVRRSVTRNFPEGVPSDFCMLLEARKNGLRGVHASDVLAQYNAVSSPEAEFDRKVRTILRGMRSVWLYKDFIFSKKDKFLTYQIFCHKVLRWLVPIFGILLFIVSFFSIFENFFWLFVFLGYLGLFGLAAKAYIDPASNKSSVVRFCFFFCLSNIAILVSWKRFLMGENQALWTPSDKN
jgi:cellulose synthase/poly-beta-1,6-N-acetylglucosamine synthase-like glycosyltransferase